VPVLVPLVPRLLAPDEVAPWPEVLPYEPLDDGWVPWLELVPERLPLPLSEPLAAPLPLSEPEVLPEAVDGSLETPAVLVLAGEELVPKLVVSLLLELEAVVEPWLYVEPLALVLAAVEASICAEEEDWVALGLTPTAVVVAVVSVVAVSDRVDELQPLKARPARRRVNRMEFFMAD
jgi:hypothetical protein